MLLHGQIDELKEEIPQLAGEDTRSARTSWTSCWLGALAWTGWTSCSSPMWKLLASASIQRS